MRIKNFIAANISEAMQQVRQELGSDVVILSNQTIDGEVHLTVAIDESVDFDFKDDDSIEPVDTQAFFNDSLIREALEYHDVLEEVRGKIIAACRENARCSMVRDDKKILEASLSRLYSFAPLLDTRNPFKMFMGTPGSGKSTAIAKLATQAKLKGINTAIISTDNSKAGANKQLEAFANILELDFFFFREPRELFKFTQTALDKYGLVLIDTPGVNPFIASELNKVEIFAEALKCDKIMTFDAGRNVYDVIEIAEIFAELGVKYLLPTRLDLTRRVGAMLSVAYCCGLTFTSAGVSSSIAAGLAPVDSKSLAKLLLA